ncbi:MAG: S-layer homology domain-containing protein [Clostridia bacterium]|nr:S-layer homology domain-containing protein [Clostridia bacterium]
MKRIVSLIIALVMIASCVVTAAAKTGFSDVEEDRWSAASIVYAVNSGYMKGVGGDRFDPEGSLTRAMVATVLWRREGEPKPAAPSGFSDVPASEWYADPVAWARETGVVKGITDKTFEPDGKITREQLATMLFRFCSPLVPDMGDRADISSFRDASLVSDWAADPVRWAVAAGLIKGTDGNRLAPDGDATREQFAAIIERFDLYVLNAGTPLTEADFYVSPLGDDSGDGSFTHPFRTLSRAALAVRGIEKTASRGGVTVAVRAGRYVLFDFDLTPADSGAEDCPVRYVAYGDGDVTVTNGFSVGESDFVPLAEEEKANFRSNVVDKIRKADVGGLLPYGADVVEYSVYGEEGLLDVSRYPNRMSNGGEMFFEKSADVVGKTELKITNPVVYRRIEKLHTLDGVRIYGNVAYEAIFESAAIGSYDKGSATVTVADPTEISSYKWAGGFFTLTGSPDDPEEYRVRKDISVILMNASEELDAKGEFFADAKNGTLYVYEPEGEYNLIPSDKDISSKAEFISFEGISFEEASFEREYDMPVFYVDKEPGKEFKILNITDPQLNNDDAEKGEYAGLFLKKIVDELVASEKPDLITVTGDLAMGGEFGALSYLIDVLDATGVPWAPIMGNHDHQDLDAHIDMVADYVSAAKNSIFSRGDRELGCGNYLIVIRENGVPLHALIMMDTHGKFYKIDGEGKEYSEYGCLTDKQLKWYGRACEELAAMGVKESTFFCHIPCFTYREAFAAAFKDGLDRLSVDPRDGMQTGVWNEGYEDSFGVNFAGISSNPNDNGFFDLVLKYGNTKTLICGHNHENDFSIGYRGVRFVFALKTGCGFSWNPNLSGGTVIGIGSDSHASVRHHFVLS